MIIPYAVDVPMARWPISNYLLIVSIIAAFVGQVLLPEEVVEGYVLTGWHWQGMLGHMWLHGGILHLVGNLLFLWVFGNAVCAKVGNIPYLLIYIAMGLISGSTHMLVSGQPVIGASGAINGIVGLYLVWYPINEISCIWLWGLWGRSFSVSSIWMIVYWLGFDILGAVLGGQGVAYFAHLGGITAGFAVACLLLMLNIVKMDEVEKSLLECMGWKPKTSPKETTWQRLDSPSEPNITLPSVPSVSSDMSDSGWLHIQEAILQTPPSPSPMQIPTPSFPQESPRLLLSMSGDRIQITCPCGARLKVPKVWAGRKARCKQCATTIHIPGGA